MKTLGFQTFLYNPEVEPLGIQLIKSKQVFEVCSDLYILTRWVQLMKSVNIDSFRLKFIVNLNSNVRLSLSKT